MNEYWLSEFRRAIDQYYSNPYDPFMRWFTGIRRQGGFVDDCHAIATVLVDARFDQGGTRAEEALKNTISTYRLLGSDKVDPTQVPRLTSPPKGAIDGEQWRDLFLRAIPSIKATAAKILETRVWDADVLQEAIDAVPWMGVKTARLAVRWIHELLPEIIYVDMSKSSVPVDTLLYRVACRLGIVDPYNDKYFGGGSPADRKIQSFARAAFPDYPPKIDEPMWSMARMPENGGHCCPRNPICRGCIFESICPKVHTSIDPSGIGVIGYGKRS